MMHTRVQHATKKQNISNCWILTQPFNQPTKNIYFHITNIYFIGCQRRVQNTFVPVICIFVSNITEKNFVVVSAPEPLMFGTDVASMWPPSWDSCGFLILPPEYSCTHHSQHRPFHTDNTLGYFSWLFSCTTDIVNFSTLITQGLSIFHVASLLYLSPYRPYDDEEKVQLCEVTWGGRVV